MPRIFASIRDGIGFDVVMLITALTFLIVLLGIPLIYNALMSFQQVDMFNLATFIRPFVGFENYQAVLSQPETATIARNTATFLISSVVFQFAIGFGLALLFNCPFFGSSYLRGLFLASYVLPSLVVGAVWSWILAGDFGVLNYVLSALGIIDQNIFWRSNPDYSLWAVIIANIWLGIAFNMIMLSVGLAAIPKDLYEAAELDGANIVQRFLTITLPMMRSTIGAVISLGIIYTLQQFDLFAAITSGGPNNSSNVAQYWAWDLSFNQFDFGRGATISIMMLVVVMVAAVIYVRSTRSEVRG